HIGHLREGKLTAGAKCKARVNTARRNAIRRAHSATHILHYALQKNLGKHAQQQGSKVEPDYLRFDFTNSAPVDSEQLVAIERDAPPLRPTATMRSRNQSCTTARAS